MTLKILVVDANLHTRTLLRVALESLGHEVVVASSVAETLKQIRVFHAHLVVIDLDLPRVLALDFLPTLRRLASSYRAVPPTLIGIGHGDGDREFKRFGFSHIMVKPLDLDQLDRHLAAVFLQLTFNSC